MLSLSPAGGGDPGALDVGRAVVPPALATGTAAAVDAVLFGLVAAVLTGGVAADAGGIKHRHWLLLITKIRVRVRVREMMLLLRARRLRLPELDSCRLFPAVVVKGEDRVVGVVEEGVMMMVMVERRRRGHHQHVAKANHPHLGITEWLPPRCCRPPNPSASSGSSSASIEAKAEVVAAACRRGSPVGERPGVRWKAPP